VIWDAHSVVPRILIVNEGSIAFIAPGMAVFNCPLKETELSPRSFLEASSCSFRITCDHTDYRLYLIRPQSAPKLSKNHVEEIRVTLHAAADTGALIGVAP
jgi:hypothetical protein